MIQRIQTIFLVLVVASMTTFLFVPQWAKIDIETGESHEMSAFQYRTLEEEGAEPIVSFFPYIAVGIFAVLAIIVGLVEIFKFNNRVLQMKLGVLNSFLIVATLASAGWFWYTIGRQMLPHIPVGFGLGLILPAIAMVFNRMALRFIKRDEDLVRSVDRVR
ncbi:MAG: DUF4293 domain-containing protein [Cyclobacteriaceae bacterium]|nr:DUF4293 domain-containing protein [Cyclobacteriaceae bacterium]